MNSVRKGKEFEREIAKTLRSLFPNIRRTVRSGAMKKYIPSDEADLYDYDMPFAVECKNNKGITVYGAYAQAVVQNTDKFKIPLVAYKLNNKPTLWIMEWGDALELLRFAMEAGYAPKPKHLNTPVKKVKQNIEETKDMPFSKFKQTRRANE